MPSLQAAVASLKCRVIAEEAEALYSVANLWLNATVHYSPSIIK